MNIESLHSLTPESLEENIKGYAAGSLKWINQHIEYWNKWHDSEPNNNPEQRLIDLLNIVRFHGWGMNRQGQCNGIIKKINDGQISRESIILFWENVNALSKYQLRGIGEYDSEDIKDLISILNKLKLTLREWHQSCDSVCFLTKVVLMFNWGEVPAFDRIVCNVLKFRSDSNEDLVKILSEISRWIKDFESKYGSIDELALKALNGSYNANFKHIPMGRIIDLVLFNLGKVG